MRLMNKIVKTDKADFVVERQQRGLFRLQTLIDVLFALVIWRTFQLLPRLSETSGGEASIIKTFSEQRGSFVLILVGLILTIIYWAQNNALFGNLRKTDNKHAFISILQIFALLLYMYTVRLGIDFGPVTLTLGLQSIMLAVVGFLGGLGWYYARYDRHLLGDAITDEEAKHQQIAILAEPISALISLPFAWIDPWLWELSWFVYPVLAAILKRRKKVVSPAKNES